MSWHGTVTFYVGDRRRKRKRTKTCAMSHDLNTLTYDRIKRYGNKQDVVSVCAILESVCMQVRKDLQRIKSV